MIEEPCDIIATIIEGNPDVQTKDKTRMNSG